MKLSLAATAGFLLASGYVLAYPSTFAERSLRRGRPALPVDVAAQEPTPAGLAADANPTVMSGNWAGVVLPSPPTGQNFTGVSGTFNFPSLANSSYAAACAWIGIDGWSTSRTEGLFQAGVNFWTEDDKLTYDAWYEWVPDTSYNFTDFGISAGDVLTFRLFTLSDSAGTIYLENESTGQVVTKDLSAPPSPPFTDPQLSLQSPEWIMEDFFWYGQVPLADFGSIVSRMRLR
ncbi:concanavalin A-like lectin/glucanase [Dichomitus squalens LYAD-421 SS1]|uniref:Concanavalin A-like lectin/glucanase n=1 Tax=Dichomitus squalens (strain LYAD-421) TaxID=732165 RepID=R7SJ05_DICSQ|nr:concanavalin A-like lectin/glucanase [Dichomitus squalens LYAD-421 SS1]EJF56124.1 concanavalin A-like lectin/glucanase [Dichomitus squalens LYAD-421 SS1]